MKFLLLKRLMILGEIRMVGKKEESKRAFINEKYWKPSLTRISHDTGIPVSTLFDHYNSLEKRLVVKIKLKKGGK